MEMHDAKRVSIVIEAPLETRLTDALMEAGVTGYTVMPVTGGSGRSGQWTRDGQLTGFAGRAVLSGLLRNTPRKAFTYPTQMQSFFLAKCQEHA